MKNSNFFLLIGSQLFSVLGTTICQFALSLYVLDVTQSAFLFSIITSLAIVGRLICLPISGVLADRLPKKKLMIGMDFFYLLTTIALLYVSQLNQAVLFIGILTVVLGMVSAFETPVVQSTISLVCSVEELPRANGVISSIGLLGNILGPILAGVIYRLEAVYQVFMLCALFFVLAIVCELFLKIPLISRGTSRQSMKEVMIQDILEVINYLKKEVIIVKICFVAFLLNLFLSSFIQVFIPFITRIHLDVSNAQFGLMNTCFAMGSLIGTLIYSLFADKFSTASISKNLFLVSIIFCLLLIPFVMIDDQMWSFWVMTLLVTAILGVVTLVSVQLIVYIQVHTSQELLGRVMSFVLIISTLAAPFGQVIYGAIGNRLTPNFLVGLILSLTAISLAITGYSKKIFVQMKIASNGTN